MFRGEEADFRARFSSLSATKAYGSIDERLARGLEVRGRCLVESNGEWGMRSDSVGAIELLKEQSASRIRELVPLRYERMSASPFAFFRGAAIIMAADLATLLGSGIKVQCIGDAHIANFGIFASPIRHLVFDVNDFDETAPGPWEWDIKRLAASIEICARDRGFPKGKRKDIVKACARTYRRSMKKYSEMSELDRQRLIQSTSDILLGWTSADNPLGEHRDYYVRQRLHCCVFGG